MAEWVTLKSDEHHPLGWTAKNSMHHWVGSKEQQGQLAVKINSQTVKVLH